jgi:geranylgeranyl diphosphate synthase type I
VGEAFQLRDDLMGAFGSSTETGKPVGDDLREGKPTMLLAYGRELTRGADAGIVAQRRSSRHGRLHAATGAGGARALRRAQPRGTTGR